MNLTYRVPAPDELEDFMRPVWRAFGDPTPEPDTLVDDGALWEPERSLGALDGDQWVGGTGAFTMDLTLPGGGAVPAAGVTMVGVAPTHRRRGILTELMRRQLDDVAAGPEPVAMLTASESLIYGRYGYGLGTRGARRRLAVAHGALRPDAPSAGGRGRLVTVDRARALLPPAYERIRAGRPGSVRRSTAWWETHLFLDRAPSREGASALYVAVHEDGDGAVDGWAAYRMAIDWPDRLPGSTLQVVDLEAADDAVRLDLWRLLLAHDLVVEVDQQHGPLDDPLVWSLADPRRLRTTEITDWLWVRVLDVAAAFGPRRWGGAGSLVVEVVDERRPEAGGRFSFEADDDGRGAVRATRAPADLVLGPEEVGALLLGTVAPSALARVGRIVEERGGALRTADALFGTERAPHCCTMF